MVYNECFGIITPSRGLNPWGGWVKLTNLFNIIKVPKPNIDTYLSSILIYLHIYINSYSSVVLAYLNVIYA